MQNTALYEKTILRKILALETHINSLGQEKSLRTRWNTSGANYRVTIGADTECYTFNRKQKLKIGRAHSGETPKLIETIYQSCAKLLCCEPFIDSFALELNPTPGGAKHIIRTFRKLAKTITSVADQMGWDFAMGAGHWHLSVEDTGRERGHLLNDSSKPEGYSDFAQKLADNIVTLQRLCPALFLRPSRSEKTKGDVPHTKTLAAGGERWHVIKRNGEFYPNGSHMFEMRMAHLSPYVPVLMLLHAVERTLKGDQIEVQDYKARAVTLERGSIFIRGKACYFDDLKTTAESGYLERHFKELRPILLNECIASYRHFLSNPAWSFMYDSTERTQALKRLATQYPDFELPKKSSKKIQQQAPGSLSPWEEALYLLTKAVVGNVTGLPEPKLSERTFGRPSPLLPFLACIKKPAFP